MTKEERNQLKTEINKAIMHISRGSGFTKDEVESILIDDYVDDYDFTPIGWPEVQELMDEEGFRENCHLINDERGIDTYGSSAYMVNKKWLNSL